MRPPWRRSEPSQGDERSIPRATSDRRGGMVSRDAMDERFALSERPTPLADVELAAQLVAFGLVVLHQLGRGD